MEIRRRLTTPCGPERLYEWVGDLDVYPQWMSLVHAVERDGADAWNVELHAQIGPFTRSKRLRMVRTVHVPGSEAVFERTELDGKHHSSWVLRAVVEPSVVLDRRGTDAESELTMELHYGGGLWSGAVLQRVLDDAVRRGSERLLELVSAPPTR